jgi:hypothetical protein
VLDLRRKEAHGMLLWSVKGVEAGQVAE